MPIHSKMVVLRLFPLAGSWEQVVGGDVGLIACG